LLAIFSACDSETAQLRSLLQVEQDQDLWFFPNKEEPQILIASLGVGFLTAAIQSQLYLSQFPEISNVLFMGTAGVYPDAVKFQTHQHYWVKDTILCDAGAVLKKCHYAPPLKRGSIPASTIFLEIKNQLQATVVTALTLTKDDLLAGQIYEQTKGELENMELFGMAQVCQKFTISWNSLLAVTNQVGFNGSKEWFENHLILEQQAGEFLFEILKKYF
jgi:nucleoside phosphorylase